MQTMWIKVRGSVLQVFNQHNCTNAEPINVRTRQPLCVLQNNVTPRLCTVVFLCNRSPTQRPDNHYPTSSSILGDHSVLPAPIYLIYDLYL